MSNVPQCSAMHSLKGLKHQSWLEWKYKMTLAHKTWVETDLDELARSSKAVVETKEDVNVLDSGGIAESAEDTWESECEGDSDASVPKPVPKPNPGPEPEPDTKLEPNPDPDPEPETEHQEEEIDEKSEEKSSRSDEDGDGGDNGDKEHEEDDDREPEDELDDIDDDSDEDAEVQEEQEQLKKEEQKLSSKEKEDESKISEATAVSTGEQSNASSTTEEPQQQSIQTERARRASRPSFTPRQVEELENIFNVNQYPCIIMRNDLASRMSVTEERVRIWFKNRRAKFRRLRIMASRNSYATNHTRPVTISLGRNCSVSFLQQPGHTWVVTDQVPMAQVPMTTPTVPIVPIYSPPYPPTFPVLSTAPAPAVYAPAAPPIYMQPQVSNTVNPLPMYPQLMPPCCLSSTGTTWFFTVSGPNYHPLH